VRTTGRRKAGAANKVEKRRGLLIAGRQRRRQLSLRTARPKVVNFSEDTERPFAGCYCTDSVMNGYFQIDSRNAAASLTEQAQRFAPTSKNEFPGEELGRV